jgi:hypothetical protein
MYSVHQEIDKVHFQYKTLLTFLCGWKLELTKRGLWELKK